MHGDDLAGLHRAGGQMGQMGRIHDPAIVELECPLRTHRAPAGAAFHDHAAAFDAGTVEDAHDDSSPSLEAQSNQISMFPVPRAFSYSDKSSPRVRQAAPPIAPTIWR